MRMNNKESIGDDRQQQHHGMVHGLHLRQDQQYDETVNIDDDNEKLLSSAMRYENEQEENMMFQTPMTRKHQIVSFPPSPPPALKRRAKIVSFDVGHGKSLPLMPFLDHDNSTNQTRPEHRLPATLSFRPRISETRDEEVLDCRREKTSIEQEGTEASTNEKLMLLNTHDSIILKVRTQKPAITPSPPSSFVRPKKELKESTPRQSNDGDFFKVNAAFKNSRASFKSMNAMRGPNNATSNKSIPARRKTIHIARAA